MERRKDLGSRFIRINLDIVPNRIRRPETIDAARSKKFIFYDLIEQRTGIFVQPARLGPDPWVIQNARKDARQLPGVEEGRPVNERDYLAEREMAERFDSGERGPCDFGRGPIDRRAIRSRLADREHRPLFPGRLVALAVLLLLALIVKREAASRFRIDERADHRHRA